ncbi:MAG TPA: hypothetical protein VFM13_09705 [Gaiellaceae bacterium]|nr:hypothetical protein [Gaiellaceae bacterium]
MKLLFLLAVFAVGLALAVAACGGDGGETPGGGTGGTTTSAGYNRY